jgi:hypothetical protein
MLKFIGAFGVALGGALAVSEVPDIPYLGPPEPFVMTEQIEAIKGPFYAFVSQKQGELTALGRHIAHAMTFPLNEVMADNIARAFRLLNTITLSNCPISFIDVIDLQNSQGTYPTFPYVQLGPNPPAWGDGICLASTFFGRSILPDPRFRMIMAKRHPENLYPGAVARYQEQLYYSPEQIRDKVGEIDFGVFYEPHRILKQPTKVDLMFTFDDQGLGRMIFEIYRDNKLVVPDPNITKHHHGLSAQKIQALPRAYYFLLAHSPVTLPQNSSIQIIDGFLIRKINGAEDFRVNIDPNYIEE